MDSPLKLDTPSLNPVFTPVNIAILASLGLHAFVLGLALPNLTWPEPTETTFEDQSPVGVIELTPAEQSRLPNTDPLPTNPLLPFAAGNEVPSSLPMEPGLPAAPDSNYNYQLPNSSGLPPLPAMPPLPNLPAYPNLPPLTSYGNLSRLPIQNPPIPSLPPLPSSRRLPRLPSASPPRLPLADGDPALPPIAPNDPARPQFAPLPPPQGTDFITKAPSGQENDTNGGERPALTVEGEDSTPDQIKLNSLTSIAKQGVAIKAKKNIPGAYPPIACRNRTEASVIYNVFPSGQKDLVGRSRYPIFNELAAKAISGQNYAQPTQVTISFQYDPEVCAGVSQFGTPPTPANPRPPVTPTTPTLETPSSPTPSSPSAVETPRSTPTQTPLRPTRTPSSSPSGVVPASPIPSAQPTPVPDAPVPTRQPSTTVTPRPTPRSTVPPASETRPQSPPPPTVSPSPAAAPPPASPSPRRSLPKSKGEILQEQNQAPFVPPSPTPTPPSRASETP